MTLRRLPTHTSWGGPLQIPVENLLAFHKLLFGQMKRDRTLSKLATSVTHQLGNVKRLWRNRPRKNWEQLSNMCSSQILLPDRLDPSTPSSMALLPVESGLLAVQCGAAKTLSSRTTRASSLHVVVKTLELLL